MNSEPIEKHIWENIDPLLDAADMRCFNPLGPEWRKLVDKLTLEFPFLHSDGTYGEDLIHWRWATAMETLLYLGSLLEQKRKKEHDPTKRLQPEFIQVVEDTLKKAYEIGKKDAPNREKRKSI